MGCNQETRTEYVPVPTEPVQPVQPIEPAPPVETIPSAGVGSIRGDLDCTGGTITTKYSFGNVSEDSKDFVIQYQRNGQTQDLVYPALTNNGSRATISDTFYAGPNPNDTSDVWIVTINYQLPNETYTLVTASLRQPACQDDGNVTTAITEFKVL